MIDFREFKLDNGLHVIVHEDPSVQIAVLNILYKVGSRDEKPDLTGFAHLFEHLMFGGSVNIADFDGQLQLAGGENNAFTSPDITNYYMTVPYQNLETAFWLESDRMLGLPFSDKVLEVQRSVVIEEFKQRYLNQPYGDVWLKLRPLAYTKHPYRWATIGKDISHIEVATMESVKGFYQKYYNPNNAILVLAGNVKFDEVKALCEKWFGPIEPGDDLVRDIPKEPTQKSKRVMEHMADVPSDMLYMTFHMPGKFEEGYYAADLLSDVLGREKSSRLYQQLVHDKKAFTSISAYVMGSIDPGMLVISGKLSEGFTPQAGEELVWGVIEDLQKEGLRKNELLKAQNQAISTIAFGELEVLNRAMGLAYAALSGDTKLINQEKQLVERVTEADVMQAAHQVLSPDNCSVLYYKSKSIHHEN